MALAVALALATVWIAIAASYQTNWPIGFFVGVISAAAYTAGRIWTYARRHRVGTRREAVAGSGADPALV